MKVLTAEQMRAVDRRTTELGIPGIVLMENAGNRVVDVLAKCFAPLEAQRIVVLCGKGNNGGDGLVVARQLYTRFHTHALHVVLAGDPAEMRGDAAANFKMLRAAGCPVSFEITPEMRTASLIVDALLGTGIHGSATGRPADWIHAINRDFPLAKVVSVDLPSGLDSDSALPPGEAVRADHTVTFTAPKPCQVLSPACELVGRLHIVPIGSAPAMYEEDPSIWLSLSEPQDFIGNFQPRSPDSNKGMYGHVLVIAGSAGKTGAAAMAGIAALRAGAGLVTVASSAAAIPVIAGHAPEIMTEALPEHAKVETLTPMLQKKNVIALGPGMGQDPDTVEFIRHVVKHVPLPMVVDADGLNALRPEDLSGAGLRILTPHPGEMSRLTGQSIAEIQDDRVGCARSFAAEHHVCLVLKGNRTVIAFPDGRVWINPTGSPAMATGGTGDVLTGLIAGMIAQFPKSLEHALLAAVYLHGRAGELGAEELGEKPLIATDLFDFLPEAMREVADLSDAF